MFLLFFSVLYVNNTVKAERTEESCNDFVNSHGIFIGFPTEDSHFKEREGRSPVSKWEMNVGRR